MDGEDVNAPSRTLSSIFREVLPYYMYLGMTPEEYWHGDPLLPIYYRKAHILKKDDANERMWLQGYYNYVAVATALQNGFREKGKKAEPYLKEPIRIRDKTELETEREVIQEREKLVTMLNQMKTDYDKKQRADDGN